MCIVYYLQCSVATAFAVQAIVDCSDVTTYACVSKLTARPRDRKVRYCCIRYCTHQAIKNAILTHPNPTTNMAQPTVKMTSTKMLTELCKL